MTLNEWLIVPFADYAFMRRALAACVILAMGSAPLGCFMILRRMTLAGDALGHSLLPGVAVAFLAAGLSVWPMTLGALGAGATVAGGAVLLTRFTSLKEDAALTTLYLVSLSLGVTLVSLKGSQIDLMHLLFGNILGIRTATLVLITASTCLALFAIAALYRRLVIDGFDPDYMKAANAHQGAWGRRSCFWTRQVFFLLLMLNLVAAFQALGSLMGLGIMFLPVIAAGFWARRLESTMALGMAIGVLASAAGLLVSYHTRTPSGPAVVLVAGFITLFSAIFGRYGTVRTTLRGNG